MKFIRFNGSRLGLLNETNDVIDLTDRLDLSTDDPLREYIRGEFDATEYSDISADFQCDDVRLEAPLKRPGKIIAAAGNYAEHIGEIEDEYVHPDQRAQIDELKYFLKAPSSIAGPADTVELPFSDRRCDHEVELAFVIGEGMKDVTPEEALEYVFGYTLLLDISIRGTEDRSYRKSFDTFTPIGPTVVTADAIDDPQSVDLSLKINDEIRQLTNTKLMINTCAEIASFASVANTLEAGDLVTTGTPSGVHPLVDGDKIHAVAEEIGEMRLPVAQRDVAYEDIDWQSATHLRK